MRFGILAIPLILFAGCGPTGVTTAPQSVNVMRGDEQMDIQGTWRVALLEVPPDFNPEDLAGVKSTEFTLTGDLLKVLLAEDPNPIFFRVLRDNKATPRTMQLSRVDEKGQPVVPVDMMPVNLFTIYKTENGILTVAITVGKDTPPRDFRPRNPDDTGSAVFVVNLQKKG